MCSGVNSVIYLAGNYNLQFHSVSYRQGASDFQLDPYHQQLNMPKSLPLKRVWWRGEGSQKLWLLWFTWIQVQLVPSIWCWFWEPAECTLWSHGSFHQDFKRKAWAAGQYAVGSESLQAAFNGAMWNGDVGVKLKLQRRPREGEDVSNGQHLSRKAMGSIQSQPKRVDMCTACLKAERTGLPKSWQPTSCHSVTWMEP